MNAGYIKAVGSEVNSEISPVIVGPTKYAAIEITPIRAIAKEGATPFICEAPRMNAGNIGPTARINANVWLINELAS